jgi:HD-like signal output (HDOD) protein
LNLISCERLVSLPRTQEECHVGVALQRRRSAPRNAEPQRRLHFPALMGLLAGRWIVNTAGTTLEPLHRAADMNKDHIPAFTLVPEKRAAEAKPPAGPATPRFIDDVAAGRVELPTIPAVVQRLIKALRDPDVDARKIGEALSRDPVLSAKVLRVANSAFFGGQRSMASIDAAVAMIGTQALYKLVVACGVEASFEGIQSIDLRLFWRDALVAATAASKLAPRLAADPEAAYLCGLLHATGHLILCRSYPDIANAMFAGFAVVRGAELAAIELEAFGIDHPAVGTLWVESLGFPQAIAEAVGSATRPLAGVHQPLDLALRSACSLAAAVARNDSADVAWATLPPGVRAQYLAANGEADAAFNKLYEALLQTEPAF